MKAIMTASLIVMGLAVSNAEAGHLNQAKAYATTIDQEAHHLDEDMHKTFPNHVLLQKRVHQFLDLAHATRKLVHQGHHLQQAEDNVHLMQKLLANIDQNLHFLVKNQPPLKKQKTLHMLKVVHQLDNYLEALDAELHDLNQVVILPPPFHGHGHFHGYGNNHIVIKPAGIHIHKGGFALNLPF
ncbi:MAG TPA: hypothetical protein VLA12_01820 [Planctomycetaceae bacterium]|nr:hypothetical protein [Planctomycetaceae bacterium]